MQNLMSSELCNFSFLLVSLSEGGVLHSGLLKHDTCSEEHSSIETLFIAELPDLGFCTLNDLGAKDIG